MSRGQDVKTLILCASDEVEGDPIIDLTDIDAMSCWNMNDALAVVVKPFLTIATVTSLRNDLLIPNNVKTKFSVRCRDWSCNGKKYLLVRAKGFNAGR